MRRVKLVNILAVLMVLLLSACMPGEPESDDALSQAEARASFAAGEALFMENCSSCHPRTGRGNYLKRLPKKLLNRRSEHELKEWIVGSYKHREMPNFDNLNETQLNDLATYLKQETGK
ncbi:MAG: cytochrome c [Porticoccaceae bacterium]|nr:cytochrome c [Porticoccaceae bacterium]